MNIDVPERTDIPALRLLWQEAFGDSDDFLDDFWNTAFSPDRCRCVKMNGSLAASLYWFDCLYNGGRVAYLYAVATAKSYRGMGICSALMKNVHHQLKEKGYTGVILVPGSPELFEFYKKIGYSTFCYVEIVSSNAAEQATAIRNISKAEYTELRRKFLPEDSVIQQNENIEFLNTQARFYTGEGFLLAARIEKDALFGAELLGNTDSAAKIVRALGCKTGRFRVPGGDVPFAMFLSLDGSTHTPPSYFGLAFD